jgi:glycosyltransferase involved in cell wall biosynthesis
MSRKFAYISVIVPVYNDQRGLNTCLDALLSQSYPRDRFEIIVVDNASSPPIVINRLKSENVKLVVCPIPGSYAARNEGLKAVNGEIIAFTDADCQPRTDWLKSGVNAIEHYGGKCIIGGEVNILLPSQPTAVELYQFYTGFMQKENIERLGFTATANLFVPKNIFENVGMFNEELLSGGDREWCWRAGSMGYGIKYASDACVMTTPRPTIASAFRQAARVAGGRWMLQRMNLSHIKPFSIKPHRSSLSAVTWILKHPDLCFPDRLRVLSAAVLIKFWASMETSRLKFMGGKLHR